MIIRVGTANPVKLRAVRAAARAFYPRARVEARPAESGVSPQPISLGEIIRGARTRAAAARGEADLGVGIESGLFRVEGAAFNVTIAAATDGASVALGGSPFLEMPPEAVDMVLKGDEELGEALSRSLGIANPARGAGAIGVLTRGRVTRQRATELAVLMAFSGLPRPGGERRPRRERRPSR
jgi:inosine/xanthosine triphosphatase